MESLNKKSTTGISGGLSFASAAAAGAKPAATTPATTTGPTKNGGAASAPSSSPALGSQSPAPSGTDSKTAATTTINATTAATTTTNANSNNGAIDWVLGMNVKVVTLADEVFEGQVYAYDVIMNCVCPSKSVSAAATPTAYYSPSLGNNNSNNNNNGNNGNTGSRLKYDFRILKINYIKEATPLLSSAGSTSTITTPTTTPTTPAAGQNHNGQSNNNSIPSESTSASEDNSNNNITNNIYSTALPAIGYVQLDKIQQREQQAIREAQAAAARIGVGVSTIGQDIFDALSKTLPCRWHKDQIVVMDEVIISSPYESDNCKANASAAATLARVKKVLEGERLRMSNGRK
ncbi:hypothetical protein EC957_003412 [Mortierella hygrophila]|uniref:AD domain-containing protein n=1 Tax=Mortierella hygrophila TaxID=979708 RepID=A0A9P6F2V3_9FUNG|nr:hypothetical protein EC957_003412 [Mortierella hygrophila]